MTEISRVALFGKLNSVGYKAVEGATVFCKMRGNPYVEIVHWVAQIVQLPDSDFHRIINHYKVDQSRLAADMTRALDALPRGASTTFAAPSRSAAVSASVPSRSKIAPRIQRSPQRAQLPSK